MRFATPNPAYDELRTQLFGSPTIPWEAEGPGGGTSPEAAVATILTHLASLDRDRDERFGCGRGGVGLHSAHRSSQSSFCLIAEHGTWSVAIAATAQGFGDLTRRILAYEKSESIIGRREMREDRRRSSFRARAVARSIRLPRNRGATEELRAQRVVGGAREIGRASCRERVLWYV